MNPETEKHKINELLLLLLDGQINDQQFAELERYLRTSPGGIDEIQKFIKVLIIL